MKGGKKPNAGRKSKNIKKTNKLFTLHKDQFDFITKHSFLLKIPKVEFVNYLIEAYKKVYKV